MNDSRPIALSVWEDVTNERRRDDEFEHVDGKTYQVKRARAIEPGEDPLTIGDIRRILAWLPARWSMDEESIKAEDRLRRDLDAMGEE